MGDYRVTIEALGGHGCERDKGTGATVYGCQRRDCPDCAVRALVKELQACGNIVKKAELVHWPADLPGYTQAGQVTDNLLTRERTGSFFAIGGVLDPKPLLGDNST